MLGLFDKSGGKVVEYVYDSWGKLISTTGSKAGTLGAANPFRYRGYYYDSESGLYYLNSRYYDPETGRFVNADGVLGANQDLLGYNLFAYCSNNPVNNSDPSGRAVHSIGIAGDFTLFWGLAISIAVAWDDDGNVGLIWSKSGTDLVNEPYAGIVDVSAQIFYQYTAVDTLDDITGPAINGGLSGGYVVAGGFDVVNVPGKEGSLHGFKVGVGAGIGVDGHVSTSTTQIITQKKSEKTRRASVHKAQNNMEHGGTGRGF